MICEALIREALSLDLLEEAQRARRMKVAGNIIRERRALVHSALARCVPTEGQTGLRSGSAS